MLNLSTSVITRLFSDMTWNELVRLRIEAVRLRKR